MHSTISRFIIIVLDSVGVGALPDARDYGDEGSDTLGHIFEAVGNGFDLPNLAKLGLYKITPQLRNVCGVSPLYSQRGDKGEFGVAVNSPAPSLNKRGENNESLKLELKLNGSSGATVASFGKMACASPAKDTTAGHWELAGVVLDKPFPVYPKGFPSDVITEFENKIGAKTLGNTTASGTEIIARLGDEHCRTGYPIVYTSADSVFQIAAHEQVFGLEKLYEICRVARQMLTGSHAVGRVIARPFTGEKGNYARTVNRRDYSLSPSGPTILDRVKDMQGSVIAVGKIEDIFNKSGITKAVHTSSNRDGFLATLELVKNSGIAGSGQRTIIFSNLVDFDMLWGHRRDVESYAKGLKEFDNWLPELLAALKDEDILIITADHGCDPTFKKHTDHTREYVPLLVYGKKSINGVDLGVRKTFADVAQTIADAFRLKPMPDGVSFAREIGIS